MFPIFFISAVVIILLADMVYHLHPPPPLPPSCQFPRQSVISDISCLLFSHSRKKLLYIFIGLVEHWRVIPHRKGNIIEKVQVLLSSSLVPSLYQRHSGKKSKSEKIKRTAVTVMGGGVDLSNVSAKNYGPLHLLYCMSHTLESCCLLLK